ncbi:hypothetical protein F2P45_29445 [Massilia sp. CCM 8733]|uniref:Uncharacterized protein n=1 Tax=Massilia mucilaginosa TaxID=2609282 RepID=A0ABX0P1Z2_9BURK|nr:hypothetical protein [Massilia mucilaginosa]NHZ93104.1 hypothetical protein [Massilia mucilaginosa]
MLEYPSDRRNALLIKEACNSYASMVQLRTIVKTAIEAGRITAASLPEDFAGMMAALTEMGTPPAVPGPYPERMRVYSMTIAGSRVSTQDVNTHETRQDWFDGQLSEGRDHYYLDIGANGDLIDAGLANTGDEFLKENGPSSDEGEESSLTRAPINISAITKAMLAKASEQPDLDVALRPLMKAAGILHGDVAGMVFAGPNGERWPTATSAHRLEMLAEWMHTEHCMADLSRDHALQDEEPDPSVGKPEVEFRDQELIVTLRQELETHDLHVSVKNADGGKPRYLPSEPLRFTVFRESKELGTFDMADQEAICLWFKETVGYDPRDEPGFGDPLLLVEAAAQHMMYCLWDKV